jgi:hypothetical protein
MTGMSLTDETIIELYPLHISSEGDEEREVGRPDTGTFVSLPPEGVDLVTWLQAGLAVGEVKTRFAARYGQPPDLDDFVAALIECGFVRGVDGHPVEADEPAAQPARGWQLLAGLAPERVAWLRSRPMVVLYVAIWLAVAALLAFRPGLFPSAGDAIVLPRVMANIVALTALGWGLVFFHEVAHLLAAKAYGSPSFLNISRRLHFLVAVTDMTALRAVPRNQRYGPYLAGMTWDMGVLLACLLLQLAGLQTPLTAAVAYLALLAIVFQFAFFMRTDIYFVFVNWLRLGNLMQDTQHWLVNLLYRAIGRPARHDLSAVPARELRAVRRYAIFWIVGVVVAVGEFLLLGLPLLARLVRDAAAGLRAGPGDAPFWDGAAFLVVVALYFGLLVYVQWRDMGARRGRTLQPEGAR